MSLQTEIGEFLNYLTYERNVSHNTVDAYRDDLETAKALVEAKVDVKASNRYGVTPLSLACQNGNAAFVELLLAHGADPNTTLRGGETALMTSETEQQRLLQLHRPADISPRAGQTPRRSSRRRQMPPDFQVAV